MVVVAAAVVACKPTAGQAAYMAAVRVTVALRGKAS
jgi:hypothetical protein